MNWINSFLHAMIMLQVHRIDHKLPFSEKRGRKRRGKSKKKKQKNGKKKSGEGRDDESQEEQDGGA